MSTTNPSAARRALPRVTRLQLLLELLNRVHCRRRLLGLPTSHLYARCRRLSRAWLDTRLSS